jgi:hypothetical protein
MKISFNITLLLNLKNYIMKKVLFVFVATMLLLSSCSTSRTMRDSNARLNLTPADLEISEQYTAEAKVVKVFGIDWKRLFRKDGGSVEGAPTSGGMSLANLPIIGGFVQDRSQSYALSNLYQEHQGYDCVVFPKFTTTRKNYVIFSTTVTKVESRLGKIKK